MAEYDQEEFLSPEDQLAREEADYERIQLFGAGLQAKFKDYDTRRKPLELKWLQDLRQFYGQYDPDVEQDLKAAGSSQLFVNITRPKTNTFAARMSCSVARGLAPRRTSGCSRVARARPTVYSSTAGETCRCPRSSWPTGPS